MNILGGVAMGVGLFLTSISSISAQTQETKSMKLEETLPTQKEIAACSIDLFCSKLRLSMQKQSDLNRLLFITDPSALAGVPELGGLIQGVTRELPGFEAPLGLPGQGVTIGPDANGLPSTGQPTSSGLTPSGFGMLDIARKVTLGDFAQDHGWDSQGNFQIQSHGPRRGGSYAENDGGEPAGGESPPDAGQSTPDDPAGDGGTSSSGTTGSGGSTPTGGTDANSPENDWQYDWSYVYRSPDNQEKNWSCCDNGSSFAPGWMFPSTDPRYDPIITNNGSGPRSDIDSSMVPRQSAPRTLIQVPSLHIKPGVYDPVYRPTEQTAVKGTQTPDGASGKGPRVSITKQTLNSVRFGTGSGAGVTRPEEGGTVGLPTSTGSPRPAPVSCGENGRPCPTR